MFSPHSILLLRWRKGLLLGLLLVAAISVRAAEISVRASVNRYSSVIGDPVQLQIKVTGTPNVGDPPEVTVDGLQIRYAGSNSGGVSQIDLSKGTFISEKTVTWIYQVVPERNGSFTIPPVNVTLAGRKYTTEPIVLKVQPSSADAGEADEKMTMAELVLTKKTAYLGEAVPAELRLYIDARLVWNPMQMPEIEGDGFSKQKFPEPRKEQVEKNGRDYNMITFKTLITPSRAGKVTIGPSELHFTARVPRARPQGMRSLLDGFGDVFNDSFFSAVQEMKAKAEPVELIVKALPQAGKPADFSGAVGNFKLAAEGSPKNIKLGDPITMKVKVSGRGDFDRVTVPVLSDPAGWRTYPPSNTFNADDQVNFSGTKTFEMAVIPETKKTAMPEFHFSYFDSIAEKYVTLKTEPAPLVVEGDALPAPKPVASTTDNEAPAPKKPAEEPRPDDILGLRYDADAPQSFTPLYERREFWFVQGTLGVIFLGLIAVKVRRKPDVAVRQRALLRQEKEAVWRRLRTAELGHVDFFDSAARLAQIQTALVTGRSVAGIDAAAVRAAAQLDESAAETIEAVFTARAELRYAGGGSDDGQVSKAERERVLGALKQLEKDHARR